MAIGVDTNPRFFRPADATPVRRNYRRVQIQRLLIVARNAVLVMLAIVFAVLIYRYTQSAPAFAVQNIDIVGAKHTPRAQLDAILRRYVGLNLFRSDIARIQSDLGALPWVKRIEIEKQIPNILRIRVVERTPVALVMRDLQIHYVDEQGVTFAELSPAVGNDDLPLIAGASGPELTRSVKFLRELRARDPQLYSRISEIRPLAPPAFAFFDRDLGALVYANADDVSSKWRSLYGIARAENARSIEYADLRFADRIVMKPRWKTAALSDPIAAHVDGPLGAAAPHSLAGDDNHAQN